eukprot:3971684-Prymnesium_polylepis.1
MVQYNLGGAASGHENTGKPRQGSDDEDPLVGSHCWCVRSRIYAPPPETMRNERWWRVSRVCRLPGAQAQGGGR